MTNTLNKIMHDGDEYLFPEGFTPESAGTTGDVLIKTANGYDWDAPSGGDIIVSPDADNVLTTGAGLWAGSESDYTNLGTYDSNTLYFTY